MNRLFTKKRAHARDLTTHFANLTIVRQLLCGKLHPQAELSLQQVQQFLVQLVDRFCSEFTDFHDQPTIRVTKTVDELNQELLALLKAQFGLRMQLATQQLSNNSQIGKVRRQIARVRTLLREKAVQ